MSSDIKSRLTPIFGTASPAKSSNSTSSSDDHPQPIDRSWGKSSLRLGKARRSTSIVSVLEEEEQVDHLQATTPSHQRLPLQANRQETQETSRASRLETPPETGNPRVILEKPTPDRGRSSGFIGLTSPPQVVGHLARSDTRLSEALQPTIAARRHSPIPDGQTRLFSALRRIEQPPARPSEYLSESSTKANMPHRKVWVKRPGSSATQVVINEDDLVDDVRDRILTKYANSLGRNFDPPDVGLRLVQRKYSARHSNHERMLSPEESVFKILDVNYPGGQTIEEALIIDVPQRRTPKHSPRMAMSYYMSDSLRPGENQTDYFPMMPIGPHSPQIASTNSLTGGQAGGHRQSSHAIAILETGQLPDLPSPGSRITRHSHRPKYGRQHTLSPTVLASATNKQNIETVKIQNPQPLPTPPAQPDPVSQRVATPPPRTSSPRLSKPAKRNRKATLDNQACSLSASNNLLDNSVPPINVLVVEDNIINLKLLEAFLKRLKVRWSTAMNGRDAVTRWREGGFHLVLMDIQLPIMNGLEATKEIRRLEKVNDIGVLSSSASSTPTFGNGEGDTDGMNDGKMELKEEDSLMNAAFFKSPVIIVALTASSLQSDRHEALAAGCNDFLTKPVNFDWLSRKVMEWGCMQALIDFDGWRNWKDFSKSNTNALAGRDRSKPSVIKTKATSQPTGVKDAISPRSATANGAPPSSGAKSRKPQLVQLSLEGIGEEGRERNTSDETDNTTDSNADDVVSQVVAVSA